MRYLGAAPTAIACLFAMGVSSTAAWPSVARAEPSARGNEVRLLAPADEALQPFSQMLECFSGYRPYYDAAGSGLFEIRFDGDALRMQRTPAGPTGTFGGRFSTSGNPVEQESDGQTIGLRTRVGATGGTIWFMRDREGSLIGAGHDRTGGDRMDQPSLDCGAGIASRWTVLPESTPFDSREDSLTWRSGNAIAVNCAARSSNGGFGEVRIARLMLRDDGALEILATDGDRLAAIAAQGLPGRSEGIMVESPRLAPGGLRVWRSSPDGDGPGTTFEIHLRTDNHLRFVRSTDAGANDVTTTCVPQPLDPRF